MLRVDRMDWEGLFYQGLRRLRRRFQVRFNLRMFKVNFRHLMFFFRHQHILILINRTRMSYHPSSHSHISINTISLPPRRRGGRLADCENHMHMHMRRGSVGTT